MYRAGFIPSLDKEGWREAPGWFEAAISQLRSDSYNRGRTVILQQFPVLLFYLNDL